MDRNEVIRYWFGTATEDLAVAEHLLQSRDRLWSLFVAHLVVEKALKAAAVSITGEHAPPIHNLLRLADLAGFGVDEARGDLFAELTRFNIEARYPKDKEGLRAVDTGDHVEAKWDAVREVLTWIEKGLK